MHFDRLDESYAMVKSNVHFDKTTLTGTHSLANSGRQHMPSVFWQSLRAKEHFSRPKLSKDDDKQLIGHFLC